jgi:hypothetical protein
MSTDGDRTKAAEQEVIRWAQAVLTAWNVGDLQKESLLHKKLREVMIAYRVACPRRENEAQGNEGFKTQNP